ncbi:23S rRNA (pseudouridine(1915)-N(3))-methyltransferase RlmH [Sanyastnella coralliicola]|uniref:23S rRNA (pseudouridine(1915)-N(3))-methyltransferase RlmH n=1 Tax=Sanyastnella coralliicola TaxID=3069118 RepID=UPI0027BB0256|nr:23S rRNA (pseudouridine(1915)-N(3))-methyltransferase RlmH [Longitalea sp. SCSIO 12813]
MKIVLIAIGKSTESWLTEAISIYEHRLRRYGSFEYIETDDVRIRGAKMTPQAVANAEAEKVTKLLQPGDHLILFDERGKDLTSLQLADWVQKKQISGLKRVVLLIGGPYGFNDELKQRASGKLSLSKLTFSHQMVRVFAIEQIYRAHTILKGEPYHHE